MNLADERSLVVWAKQGDTAAYGELVRLHQTAVFNTAYRLLAQRRDAEDATQEAFLRGFRALGQFEVERPFAPWIKRIAANVCLNWLEAARIKPHLVASDLGQPDEEVDLDNWQHSGPTPEQVVLHQEQNQRLVAGILALPPAYRAVIELRHQQGLSYDEMAEVLQRPLSAIKSDLFRARKLLAQMLPEDAPG